MNILFVTGGFANDERETAMGGMPYAVYKSALGMQQLGHKVRILTIGSRERYWVYQGVNVLSIRAQNGTEEKSAFSNFCDIWRREWKIRSTIQKLNMKENIDIIQYTGWFGIGLLHSMNIPAVMRVSSYTRVQLANNFSGMQKLMLECVEYMAAKRMNFIFAPSRIMANGIEKDVRRKVAVIETPFFQNDIEFDDHIYQVKLKDKKYILFFGRMSVDKGILTIRDVLYKVLSEYKDVYFVFIGNSSTVDGVKIESELARAAKNYKNRIIFGGMLPKERLFPIIQNSEFVLMPSLADNFPNACAEAMSLGKIVIGTNGSSLEQFIKDGENGLLATPGDADSLYSCIIKALEMKDERRQYISRQAKKRVKQLNLNTYSKKMEGIYKKILDG